MACGRRHKVFEVVTDRHELPGDEVVRRSRRRCGEGEEVHSVVRGDLAGGRLPSGLFGANAAWWAMAVPAHNVAAAMKRLLPGGPWLNRRRKALRFAPVGMAGRAVAHSRRPMIRLTRGRPSYALLLGTRRRICLPATGPPAA